MKIVIITATDIKGCTYHLKERYKQQIQATDEVVEFSFPSQFNKACIGCKLCFNQSEKACPHADVVLPIWNHILEANVLVVFYPLYAMQIPGHLKSFFDHLACHWVVHRPKEEMFTKRAVFVGQSIGAPLSQARKTLTTQMNWLGISKVDHLSLKMTQGVDWATISSEFKKKLFKKVDEFAVKTLVEQPAKMNLKVKGFYNLGKMAQKTTLKKHGLTPDNQYWIEKGWIK